MQIKTYKTGKVVLTDEGIQVWISPKDDPKVHLWDDLNRYGYVVYQGVALGYNTTVETRARVATDVVNQYKTVRGQRTSWTIDDAWLKKWKANLRKESKNEAIRCNR